MSSFSPVTILSLVGRLALFFLLSTLSILFFLLIFGHEESAAVERDGNSVVAGTLSEVFIISQSSGESVELLLANGLNFLEDGPSDALGAGRSSERTWVAPES